MTTDFEMVQGDSRYIKYECFKEDGTQLDLSTANQASWGFIRYGDFNSDPIILKTFGDGITIEDTNIAVVKLEPTDTIALSGKFEHTLQLEDFSNDKFSKNGLFLINISSL